MKETQKNTLTDAQALTGLAEAYYHGLGQPKDYKQAFRLYRKAADLGNAEALGRMGVCYEYGRGIELNTAAAMTCYEDASEKGDISAMWHLGDFYWTGVPGLVQKDVEKAAGYYFAALMAAEKYNDQWNAADVLLRVADCLYHGIGTEQSIKGAFDLYGNAADAYFNRIEGGDTESEELLERAENCEDSCRRLLGLPSETGNLS